MKIIIKNLQKKVPLSAIRIQKLAHSVFSSEGFDKNGEVTVCFVSDALIRKLNCAFLKHQGSTDVLAFTLANTRQALIGDVIVSTDAAIRNAKTYRTNPRYETFLYVVHGILHLLGYDDASARQRKNMQAKAEKILTQCSIR